MADINTQYSTTLLFFFFYETGIEARTSTKGKIIKGKDWLNDECAKEKNVAIFYGEKRRGTVLIDHTKNLNIQESNIS